MGKPRRKKLQKQLKHNKKQHQGEEDKVHALQVKEEEDSTQLRYS